LRVAVSIKNVARWFEQLMGRIDLRFGHARASRVLWPPTLTQLIHGAEPGIASPARV
jgi:hypothetical protein